MAKEPLALQRPPAHYDSYIICTAPRSGSTLLCSLLAKTGVSGNPDSYFHRPSLAHWQEDLGLAPDESLSKKAALARIFRAAIAKGRQETGIFGLRLQRHSFDFFLETLRLLHPEAPSDLQRFEAAFGRTLFVHLTRADKLEQAVSVIKARQSGLWHRAPDGSEVERLAPPGDLIYDPEAIRAQIDAFTAMDTAWTDWFAAEGIDPLRLTYRDLAADPKATLKRVLMALGRDPTAVEGIESGVAKLADETNRDWIARFRVQQASE